MQQAGEHTKSSSSGSSGTGCPACTPSYIVACEGCGATASRDTLLHHAFEDRVTEAIRSNDALQLRRTIAECRGPAQQWLQEFVKGTDFGWTSVYIAASHRANECMDILLQQGVDPNSPLIYGLAERTTPLHNLLQRPVFPDADEGPLQHERALKCMHLLLAAKADPHAQGHWPCRRGERGSEMYRRAEHFTVLEFAVAQLTGDGVQENLRVHPKEASELHALLMR